MMRPLAGTSVDSGNTLTTELSSSLGGTPGTSPHLASSKIHRFSNPPAVNKEARKFKEVLRAVINPLITGNLPVPLQLTLKRLEPFCVIDEFHSTMEFMRSVAQSSMKGMPQDAGKREKYLQMINTRHGRAILAIAISEQMNIHQRTPLSDTSFDLFAELYNTMLSRIHAQKDYKCAMVIMELSFMQYRLSGKMEHTFMFTRLKQQGIWGEKEFWINTLNLQAGIEPQTSTTKKKQGPRTRIEFERMGRLADCMIKFDHSIRRINNFIDDVCIMFAISKEDAKELKALVEQLWRVNKIR